MNMTKNKMLIFEANIDDMNPQWFDYVMEKLFAAGAVDVTLEPIQMKKNRPATRLVAMAPPSLRETIITIIFQETTTLGVRYYSVERRVLQRTLKTVRTRLGNIIVKVATDGKAIKKVVPEYESCKKLALKRKIPLAEVYREIEAHARRHMRR